jgi:hypothetical protein
VQFEIMPVLWGRIRQDRGFFLPHETRLQSREARASKIYTVEHHGHLRAVRRDMAKGRMMIPRRKKL